MNDSVDQIIPEIFNFVIVLHSFLFQHTESQENLAFFSRYWIEFYAWNVNYTFSHFKIECNLS